MAFNHKKNELESAMRANEFLQGRVAALEEEKQDLGVYYDIARTLYDEVRVQGATVDNPDTAFDRAYASVKDKFVAEERAKLQQQVVAENSDKWRAEIAAEIREKEGPAIEAKAKEDFLGQADYYRRQAQRQVADEIARMTREKLVATLTEEERQPLLQTAAEKALHEKIQEERIAGMRETSKRLGQLDLKLFEAGELLTIEFCPRGKAKDEIPTTPMYQHGTNDPNTARVLKMSVIDAAQGTMLVLDDSWQKTDDDLRRDFSVPDNTELTIGTARHNGREHRTSPEIHRGALLHLASGEDQVNCPYEVSRVWLGDQCVL